MDIANPNFWSDNIPPHLTFNDISELRQFVNRGEVSIKAVLENHLHNTQSPPSDFYKFYKSNSPITVQECYSRYQIQVNENVNHCIGRSLKIRKLLIEDMTVDYPDFKNCLYMASSTTDDKYANKLPKLRELRSDNYHMTFLSPHCVLVCKIFFDNRPGYVMFESINLHFKPIIIMNDNGFPTDTIVPLRKSKYFRFISIEGKFIRHTVESPQGLILRQMFYVEKPYLRHDFSAKLLCLANLKFLNYALIENEKIPINILLGLKCFIFNWEIDNNIDVKSIKIPFDYFTKDDINQDWECDIMKAQVLLKNEDLKSSCKYLVESIEDDKFNSQVEAFLKVIRNVSDDNVD